MSNPFAALDISDDEETYKPVTTETKTKRTHQEKRLYKQQQQQQEAAKATTAQPAVVNESFPERVRDNAKDVRDKRAPPTPYTKKLGEGHFHDRRSGTGRVDKPRKEGGGWGNVGNLKDQLNKDKYVKETAEGQTQAQPAETKGTEPEVEQKPEEPQALTLEEYYKSKGLEVSNVYEKKTASRRADLNAEWIKKEKLTILESKEDKKLSERNAQNVVKLSSGRVGLDENLESLGFFDKKPKRQEEGRKNEGRGGKKEKLREQDFPAL